MLFRVVTGSLVLAAACAQGQGGDGDDVDARATDAKVETIDAPMPVDARVTDAPPGAIDAGVDAPPGAGPDTCAQAQDITAAAMMPNGTTVTGNTTGYADDVSIPLSGSCTGFSTDGPDSIYSVTVGVGATITAVATPTTAWDISLELVQPCALTPTCHDGSDVISGAETVSFTTTAAGTYYVVVDSWDSGVAGAYSLNVRIQ